MAVVPGRNTDLIADLKLQVGSHLCDMIIRLGNDENSLEMKVHGCIMATCSEVIQKEYKLWLLQAQKSKKASQYFILLLNMEYPTLVEKYKTALSILINYCYEVGVTIDQGSAIILLSLAQSLQIDELASACQELLQTDAPSLSIGKVDPDPLFVKIEVEEPKYTDQVISENAPPEPLSVSQTVSHRPHSSASTSNASHSSQSRREVAPKRKRNKNKKQKGPKWIVREMVGGAGCELGQLVGVQQRGGEAACTLCRYTNRDRYTVRRHYVQRHVALPCVQCQLEFFDVEHLEQHRARAHPLGVDKKFECQCGWSTDQLTAAAFHVCAHRTKDLFPCQERGCDFQVSTPWFLERHKTEHRGGSGMLLCSDCDVIFRRPAGFIEHLDQHTLPCPECPFLAASTARLATHRFLAHGVPDPNSPTGY